MTTASSMDSPVDGILSLGFLRNMWVRKVESKAISLELRAKGGCMRGRVVNWPTSMLLGIGENGLKALQSLKFSEKWTPMRGCPMKRHYLQYQPNSRALAATWK